MAVWRLAIDGTERLARGGVQTGPAELLDPDRSIDTLLAGSTPLGAAIEAAATREPVPEGATLLAPVGSQEIWAAGVTFRRSRDARIDEAATPDHYDRVYAAERPELFYKASAVRVRGPDQPVGIRADSGWDVPEAELGLVIDPAGTIVGYVAGNDVSSRSIEGENPLYLPQAKCYMGSCAIGPCLVPVEEAAPFDQLRIELRIVRDGAPIYQEQVSLTEMHRRPEELVDWLYRAMDFPVGAVLLTGTALVPPTRFTLRADDEVTVDIRGVGRLTNPVEVVGRREPLAAGGAAAARGAGA